MRTSTGTFTINNVTYTYEVTSPEEIIFINNDFIPINVKITDSEGKPASAMNIQSVVVIDRNIMITDLFQHTNAEGMTKFNIAGVLRAKAGSYDKELGELQYYDEATTEWLMPLVIIRLFAQGVEFFTSSRMYAANGRHRNSINWWNTTRRLAYWEQLPFSLDLSKKTQILANGEIYNIKEMTTPLIRVNPRIFRNSILNGRLELISMTDDGYAVIDGIIERVKDHVVLDIVSCDVDLERRCYLRWLGEHGEVFYWLFYNKTETEVIKSTIYTRAMTDDQYQGSDTNRYIDNGVIKDSDTTRTRSIYSGLLSDDYYDYVRQVVSSPCVDMYLGDNRWQRVKVEDGSVSKDMKMSGAMKRHRVTLTIQL